MSRYKHVKPLISKESLKNYTIMALFEIASLILLFVAWLNAPV